MPNKSNDQHHLSQVQKLLACIDEKGHAKAKVLDENRIIYHSWAILDSISSSKSMCQYWFDLFITNNPELMHECMTKPAAIIVITIETLFLILISLIASWFEKKEKNGSHIQLIVDTAPYLREVIKGLKNAYKGWRGMVLTINALGPNLTYFIAPLGLALGIIAAIMRSFLQKLKEKRKIMMTENIELIKKIKGLTTLSNEEKEKLQQAIRLQNWKIKALGHLCASINGFIDGLYLYVGLLTLMSFASTPFLPLLIAMLFTCAIYTIACVAVRNYEIYDYELRLSITSSQAQLLLTSKELEICFNRLCLDKVKTTNDPKTKNKIMDEESRLCLLTDSFEGYWNLLKEQSKRSYTVVSLSALKNALSAYSALTSLVFVIATILSLGMHVFPFFLLAATVFVGLGLIVGFVSYSIYEKYQQSKQTIHESYSISFETIKITIKSVKPDQKSFQKELNCGLNIAPVELTSIPDFFEILRSAFSGAGKGEKFVEFIGLQEQVKPDHFHEISPGIWIIDAICALLFATTMGLRALAKGFGKEPLGKIELMDIKQTEQELKNYEVQTPKQIVKKEPKLAHCRFHRTPSIIHTDARNCLVLDSS